MTQDMECTGLDDDGKAIGDENVICEAFAGKKAECKIAVAGVQDCCDTPVNVTMSDYLVMLKAANKLGTAVAQLETPIVTATKGAYQAIGDAAASTWTEISQPFASYIENISGAVDSFTSTVTEFTDQLVDVIKEQLEKVMNEILTKLGYEGGSSAAQGAAASATEQFMNSPAMQFLGNVMTVYGYVALAIAVIKFVFKCEEEEFELNSKRKLKSCVYVGSYCKTKPPAGIGCIEERESYCCFNSPLSRIIQEQARPQLGMDWGSTKSPQCGGIPLERIPDIDWDNINLDEWLGILEENGQLNSQPNLNLETLTGSGNALSIDGNPRLDAEQRTIERIGDTNVDEIRRNNAESLSNGVDKGGNGG